MRKALLFFFILCSHCFGVDFDVIVVGTSPICLREALYRYHTGNRVLILETSSLCGGAWKSIDICGIAHVDLGCHTLGSDRQMMQFFQDYVGCQIVSMDRPHMPFDPGYSPNGFYFPRGCYEMISNLLHLIRNTDIVLLTEHPLESVYIDPIHPQAIARTRGMQFSTSKILVTPYSDIHIENLPSQQQTTTKYRHLYMLIDDPTPPRFTFHTGIGAGVSRMMNLTSFVKLQDTGRQLIVFQTQGGNHPLQSDEYLKELKRHRLIDPSSQLICAELYVYEQSKYTTSSIKNIPNGSLVFELLSTGHINSMSGYISKWKQALPRFCDLPLE